MKTSSAPAPPEPAHRAKARNCFILNQVACPGLGTILAGQRIGYCQVLVAVLGFCLFSGWMVWFIATVLRTLDYPASGHWHWLVLAGGGALFAGAWVWSLFSSLALLDAAKQR
ncbi:MAG: hypothetical protein KGS61_18620 [Verrucomicrobia bacterium]|nr:hypothetical protein [Verrucomicrobiota bacterium]